MFRCAAGLRQPVHSNDDVMILHVLNFNMAFRIIEAGGCEMRTSTCRARVSFEHGIGATSAMVRHLGSKGMVVAKCQVAFLLAVYLCVVVRADPIPDFLCEEHAEYYAHKALFSFTEGELIHNVYVDHDEILLGNLLGLSRENFFSIKAYVRNPHPLHTNVGGSGVSQCWKILSVLLELVVTYSHYEVVPWKALRDPEVNVNIHEQLRELQVAMVGYMEEVRLHSDSSSENSRGKYQDSMRFDAILGLHPPLFRTVWTVLAYVSRRDRGERFQHCLQTRLVKFPPPATSTGQHSGRVQESQSPSSESATEADEEEEEDELSSSAVSDNLENYLRSFTYDVCYENHGKHSKVFGGGRGGEPGHRGEQRRAAFSECCKLLDSMVVGADFEHGSLPASSMGGSQDMSSSQSAQATASKKKPAVSEFKVMHNRYTADLWRAATMPNARIRRDVMLDFYQESSELFETYGMYTAGGEVGNDWWAGALPSDAQTSSSSAIKKQQATPAFIPKAVVPGVELVTVPVAVPFRNSDSYYTSEYIYYELERQSAEYLFDNEEFYMHRSAEEEGADFQNIDAARRTEAARGAGAPTTRPTASVTEKTDVTVVPLLSHESPSSLQALRASRRNNTMDAFSWRLNLPFRTPFSLRKDFDFADAAVVFPPLVLSQTPPGGASKTEPLKRLPGWISSHDVLYTSREGFSEISKPHVMRHVTKGRNLHHRRRRAVAGETNFVCEMAVGKRKCRAYTPFLEVLLYYLLEAEDYDGASKILRRAFFGGVSSGTAASAGAYDPYLLLTWMQMSPVFLELEKAALPEVLFGIHLYYQRTESDIRGLAEADRQLALPAFRVLKRRDLISDSCRRERSLMCPNHVLKMFQLNPVDWY